MDYVALGQAALAIIGGATIVLNIFAPLTKNKADDKVLKVLKRFLEIVSLNVDNNKSVLTIDLKRKK